MSSGYDLNQGQLSKSRKRRNNPTGDNGGTGTKLRSTEKIAKAAASNAKRDVDTATLILLNKIEMLCAMRPT